MENDFFDIEPMMDEVGEALGLMHESPIAEELKRQSMRRLEKLMDDVRCYNVEPTQLHEQLRTIMSCLKQGAQTESNIRRTSRQQCEVFKGKMFKTGHRMDRPYMVVDLTPKGVVLDQWDFAVGNRTRKNSHSVRWMTFKEFLSEVEEGKLKLLTTREEIEAQSTQIRWRIRLIEERMQPMAEEIEVLRQRFRQLGFS